MAYMDGEDGENLAGVCEADVPPSGAGVMAGGGARPNPDWMSALIIHGPVDCFQRLVEMVRPTGLNLLETCDRNGAVPLAVCLAAFPAEDSPMLEYLMGEAKSALPTNLRESDAF